VWKAERFLTDVREQLLEILEASGNQTTAPAYDPTVKPSDMGQPEIPAYFGLAAVVLALFGTLLIIYSKKKTKRHGRHYSAEV
jgi:hypothetical protein